MNTKNITIPKIEDLTIAKVILLNYREGVGVSFHVIDKNRIVYEMHKRSYEVRNLHEDLLCYFDTQDLSEQNKLEEYRNLFDSLKSKCKEVFKDVW